MKIAIFVHCFFPDHFYGTETYTFQVAKSLQARGHQVVVVAGVFQGEPRNRGMLTRFIYDGLEVVAFDKNYLPHATVFETFWQESARPVLREILDEHKPDIVHVTHLVNHTAVLASEAKAAGYPVVATLTDFFGFCFTSKLESADGRLCKGPNRLRTNCLACYQKATGAWPRRHYKLANLGKRLLYGMVRRSDPRRFYPVGDLRQRPKVLLTAYRSYDAMIAPTQFLYDAYIRNGFDAGRMHLSRFGVDLDRRAKPENLNAPLAIAYVGQLVGHKGVDLLLRAARTLKPGSFRLKIYGQMDGSPYCELLKSLATSETEFCGTFPSVKFHEVLAGTDVLAIPSTWYENSPLVLLNSLASHTPVIVSGVQGLTEFLDGGNGWSFARGNMEELAALLQRLVSRPDETRAHSQRTFYDRTIETMVDDVVEVYGRVLGRPFPAASRAA